MFYIVNSKYARSTVLIWNRLYGISVVGEGYITKPPIPDEAIWEVFARFRVHCIEMKPILALWTAKI